MSGPTVLVVEDNAITRKMVRVALTTEGYAVLEAEDGARALELMATGGPDLVLQDLILPDVDGFELVSRLRGLPGGADVPILAFSGFLSRTESARVISHGFTDLLVKPIEPTRLLQTIRTYLPPSDVPAEPRGGRRRILVADDDPLGLKLARVHFEHLGFEVTTAADGAEALELARAAPPDAILSDVLMPRLDGFQLCLAVREDPLLRHIPLVLCSANYVEDWDRRLAERVGASALTMRTPDMAAAIAALMTSLEQASAPGPRGRADLLEAERIHRVVRQLEKQVSINAGLVQRVSLQATILSLVASLPGSLASTVDVEATPGEALATVLDTGGISSGALYLTEPGGEFRLQADVGLADGAEEQFGHPELFALATGAEQGIGIPSPTVPRDAGHDFLARAGLASAVLVPLGSRAEPLGVLLLGSRRRDLTDVDWLAFGRSVGSQLGHTIALSRAFARLTASERRYRTLFDQVPIGLFRAGPDEGLAEVNPAFAAMLRFPDVGSLLSQDPRILYVDPEDRQRLLTAARREGTVRGYDVRLRRVDGTPIWVRINMRVVDEGGRVVYEGSVEDITRLRRAERLEDAEHSVTRALAESADLREAAPRILEALCRGLEWQVGELWLTDGPPGLLRCADVWHVPSAGIEDFARQSRALTFAPGVGVPGQVWTSGAPVWIPDVTSDSSVPRAPVAAAAGLRGAVGFPIRLGGEVQGVLAFFSGEIREPEDDLLLMMASVGSQIAQSIARWRTSAEIERQRESLTQTEKLAAMGQLLAGVAHELNNPLSVVLGQAVLLRNLAGTGPFQARADKIANAADRCARIVKNFLALARQRPPERKRVDINAVAREAVELLAYGLRVDTVEVVLDLGDVPPLWADPHQLHQVVVNLVTNAHHAVRGISTLGRITLASRSDEAGGSVMLTVSDNGPGIPAEIRARIFEPFFTTKAPGEGTGLGLSLCHGIVESHGGTISVDNSPGAGAAFRVVLPVKMPPEATIDAAMPEPGQATARKRILVVDDEQEVAVLLAEILAMNGHDVDTAPNGRTALEKLRQRSYDLVLSDLRMPELDGPGLYREIERRHPELKGRFVLVTGDTLSASSRDFLARTSLPSVSKPVDFAEVMRVIRQILRHA